MTVSLALRSCLEKTVSPTIFQENTTRIREHEGTVRDLQDRHNQFIDKINYFIDII